MKNAPVSYEAAGATSLIEPIGEMRAATIKIARQQRNTGLRNLPIHVMIFPGLSEKVSTTAKKSSENTARQTFSLASPRRGITAILKGTVAQRGLAKKGPIVR